MEDSITTLKCVQMIKRYSQKSTYIIFGVIGNKLIVKRIVNYVDEEV